MARAKGKHINQNQQADTPIALKLAENDSIAIKHTGAIHVSNTLTLLQRKAANVLLKYAYKNLIVQETHRVKLSEIARDLGWSSSSHTNEKLKDAIRKLNMTQIEWNILGKDNKHEWGVATILAEATIRDGYCTYAYSPTMRKLQANPTLYARLDLLVQQSFDRSYTLALWEFLSEALCSSKTQEVETSWITLENFRRLMGVNTPYYHNFSKLNSKIIAPSLKEVNEKSDIEVELRMERKGRTIEALSFMARRKLTHQLTLPLVTDHTDSEKKSFKEELQSTLETEFSFSKKNAQKLISTLVNLDETAIQEALDHVRNRKREGHIKNLQAYTATALKGHFGIIKEPTDHIIEIKEEGVTHEGWKHVREQIKGRIGKAAYASWIGNLELIEVKPKKVILCAKTSFIKDWVKQHYVQQLQEIWHEINPAISAVEILVSKNKKKS